LDDLRFRVRALFHRQSHDQRDTAIGAFGEFRPVLGPTIRAEHQAPSPPEQGILAQEVFSTLLERVTTLTLSLAPAAAASSGSLQPLRFAGLYIEAAAADVPKDTCTLNFTAKFLYRPLKAIAFFKPYFDHGFPKKRA
tara:strand:- start:5747 stop:6160 length:414 start_codon:yes stop_codon:yes gene_type:complete